MTLHTPVHPGIAGHHVYRNLLIVIGLAVLAIVLFVAALTIKPFASSTAGVTEAQSLIEYRMGERADWGAGVISETQSLIDFRAGERDMR